MSKTSANTISRSADAPTLELGPLMGRLGVRSERLREYRQALITTAVTGQLDVTDSRAIAAHDERVEAAT